MDRKKKKTLELMSSYSKVIGYKINVWKSITFLYIRNEELEFEIKKTTMLFTLVPSKMKCLDISLTKYIDWSIWGKLQNWWPKLKN